MKTLKVELVSPVAYESLEEVVEYLPHFIGWVYNRRWLRGALGYPSSMRYEHFVQVALGTRPWPTPA